MVLRKCDFCYEERECIKYEPDGRALHAASILLEITSMDPAVQKTSFQLNCVLEAPVSIRKVMLNGRCSRGDCTYARI
jgi:hypothetical protein